jgi:hypothetical protein
VHSVVVVVVVAVPSVVVIEPALDLIARKEEEEGVVAIGSTYRAARMLTMWLATTAPTEKESVVGNVSSDVIAILFRFLRIIRKIDAACHTDRSAICANVSPVVLYHEEGTGALVGMGLGNGSGTATDASITSGAGALIPAAWVQPIELCVNIAAPAAAAASATAPAAAAPDARIATGRTSTRGWWGRHQRLEELTGFAAIVPTPVPTSVAVERAAWVEEAGAAAAAGAG